MKLFKIETFKMPAPSGTCKFVPFSGNPAAVFVLQDEQPTGAEMQMIAASSAQPETVFVQELEGLYLIRWFTPEGEISPGGNGTIAAAAAYLLHLLPERGITTNEITFSSPTTRMDFPARLLDDGTVMVALPAVSPARLAPYYKMVEAFGEITPAAVFRGKRDLMAVFDEEADIRRMRPCFSAMRMLDDYTGFIATAPSDGRGFVYRTFAPIAGVPECPGSGAALMNLVPYWVTKMGTDLELTATQLSPRGGQAYCRLNGDAVEVRSYVRTISVAEEMYELGADGCAQAYSGVSTQWI